MVALRSIEEYGYTLGRAEQQGYWSEQEWESGLDEQVLAAQMRHTHQPTARPRSIRAARARTHRRR